MGLKINSLAYNNFLIFNYLFQRGNKLEIINIKRILDWYRCIEYFKEFENYIQLYSFSSQRSRLIKDSNKHTISKVIKRNRKELKISVYIKGYTEERIIYIKDKANLNFSMFHTARKNTQILPNALLNEPIHKLLVIVSRATKTWLLLYLAWDLADVKLLEQFRSSFLSLSLSLSLEHPRLRLVQQCFRKFGLRGPL